MLPSKFKIVLPAMLALCAFFASGIHPFDANAAAAVRAAEIKKTYANPGAGFSFDYPSRCVLKETLTPGGELINVLVGEAGAGAGEEARWLIDIGVESMNAYPEAMFDPVKTTAREFAVNVAKLHCDADGPDGGSHCGGVKAIAPFTTDGGFKGYEFSLTLVRERFDEEGASWTETDVKEPVFAFEMSTGGPTVVLLAEPTDWTLESPEAKELVREIVRTLRPSKK